MSDSNVPGKNESSAVPPWRAEEPKSGASDQSTDSKTNSARSSRIVTGAGLMGALGFVVLVIAIRGGKLFVRKAVEDPGPPAAGLTPATGPGHSAELALWEKSQLKLKAIDVVRRQNKLTEPEMNEILKRVWLEKNKGSGKTLPWIEVDSANKTRFPPTESPDWRKGVEWDLDVIQVEAAKYVQSKKTDAKPPKTNE